MRSADSDRERWTVRWSEDEDAPDEWRASDDESHAGRQFAVTLVVFALPVIAFLFAGAAGTAWGGAFIAVFVLAGLVVGSVDWWRGERTAVSITDDGDLFVVRQVNGRVERFPFAAVTRVRTVRDGRGDDTVSMRISVADRVVRTRFGAAATAATFLARWEAAGAEVSYRTETAE